MPTSEAETALTRMIRDAAGGNEQAAARVLDVLRRFAASRFMRTERAGHTIQATLLADEAFLQLLHDKPHQFESRKHFFLAAAQVIRGYLIDHARARNAKKRGGKAARVDLDELDVPDHTDTDSVADAEQISIALEKLEQESDRTAQVVKLRYFTGLQVKEIAEILEISERHVRREWVFAKAWLARELSG